MNGLKWNGEDLFLCSWNNKPPEAARKNQDASPSSSPLSSMIPSLQAYLHQFMQTAAEPTKLLSCQAMTAATSMSMEYDSDQEPPETNDHLYWRLDPEVSLSDMTLVIRSKKKLSSSQASAQQVQQQSHTFSSSTVVATAEDNHTVPTKRKRRMEALVKAR